MSRAGIWLGRIGVAVVAMGMALGVAALPGFAASDSDLKLIDADLLEPRVGSPSSFAFVNAAVEQDIAISVVPRADALAITCAVQEETVECGPGLPIRGVPAGAVVEVEVSLASDIDVDAKATFQVFAYGLTTGGSLTVEGNARDSQLRGLEAPPTISVASVQGQDECVSFDLIHVDASIETLVAGPAGVKTLTLAPGSCTDIEPAEPSKDGAPSGAFLDLGSLTPGVWSANFDSTPGVAGGDTTITITRTPDPAVIPPAAMTLRSVIGKDKCTKLPIEAPASVTVLVRAQGPTAVNTVLMSTKGCDLERDDSERRELYLDVRALREAGSWKVSLDPDQAGPLGPTVVTINRSLPEWVAGLVLAAASIMTSAIAWAAIAAQATATKRQGKRFAQRRKDAAKLKGARAVQLYSSGSAEWRLSMLEGIRDFDAAPQELEADMKALGGLFGTLAAIRGLEIQGDDFAQGFARAVENELLDELQGEGLLGWADLSSLCREANLVLGDAADVEDDQPALEATLIALIESVPNWTTDNQMDNGIGQVRVALNEVASPAAKTFEALPTADTRPAHDPVGEVVTSIESSAAASEADHWFSQAEGKVLNLVVGAVALILAVATGLATQYWPKATWGSRADLWTAATWAVAGTGTVQVARLIGLGVPLFKVKS